MYIQVYKIANVTTMILKKRLVRVMLLIGTTMKNY